MRRQKCEKELQHEGESKTLKERRKGKKQQHEYNTRKEQDRDDIMRRTQARKRIVT